MNPITQYIKNAREELKKVTWPTRQETQNTTLLVVGVSLVVAGFLGAADYGLNQLLEVLLKTF